MRNRTNKTKEPHFTLTTYQAHGHDHDLQAVRAGAVRNAEGGVFRIVYIDARAKPANQRLVHEHNHKVKTAVVEGEL